MTYGDDFHPVVSFAYCLSLIALAMIYFHPVFILTGLLFAVLQNFLMHKPKQFLKTLLWSFAFCVAVVILNPLISHGGKTLLFYLGSTPVTFEAVFFGLCSGGMLMLVFLWFGVYSQIVTPDRFMYIFSRIPATSMLVTMTQRMIPLFTRRLFAIRTAQKTMPDISETAKNDFLGRMKSRLSPGISQISILLSWSMEDGLDTADSMKARGYGITRRSSFSVFRFSKKDTFALIFIAVCAICSVTAYYTSVRFRFYPRIHSSGENTSFWVSIISYIILAAALPFIAALRHIISIARNHNFSNSKNNLKWNDIWQS